MGKQNIRDLKKFLFGHQGVVNRTLWHYDDVNHTQGASMELRKLGITRFDTPKPTRLIERILQIASTPDSIILDSLPFRDHRTCGAEYEQGRRRSPQIYSGGNDGLRRQHHRRAGQAGN